MTPIQFKIIAYTDPAGKWDIKAPHEGNEDNLFVNVDLDNKQNDEGMVLDRTISLSDKGCLMVVADGMGGMNAGEVASDIAIKTVENAFCKGKLDMKSASSSDKRAAFMECVIVEADKNIKSHAKNHPECEGMGSTLIMAWLWGRELTVSWIGDSRAYLYRDGMGLNQISRDHSYVQELVDSGQLDPELAFSHPNGNIITRSLGDMSQAAKPDSVTLIVGKGDVIMLNSDGLSGVLRDKEMEQIIQSNLDSLSNCRIALWNAAEHAGWYDNVTAIICQIIEGETAMNSGGQGFRSKSLSSFSKYTNLYLVVISLFVIGLCIWGGWVSFNHMQLIPSETSDVRDTLKKDSVESKMTMSGANSDTTIGKQVSKHDDCVAITHTVHANDVDSNSFTQDSIELTAAQ